VETTAHDRRLFQLKIALGAALGLIAYCGGRGRIDAWIGWGFALFLLAALSAGYLILVRVAPDLIAERVSWGPASGAMPADKPIVTWLALAPLAACLGAGLDARFHGVDTDPVKIAFGYVLGGLGSALTNWAMASNRFYAPTVRIQKERGHKTVDVGPYAIVRHPGNLGNVLLNLGIPLMLASRWAWLPAGLSILAHLVRTALEDRKLCRELPGYREYAERTRSRLIPGIW
jgi:protein-S-isoprenylcysteine O-methyltransferase Ste14